ncbi:MAG: transposase [Synechococcales cyanobacterium K44_A2020_017]|nr:transposase [Synechococcales cyanobacterium K32_A2020_035]MBF2095728.1 transposase [Synechococcales cyanobacterium K44_A2020_017]
MFHDNDDCITYLEQIRWGDRPQCPYCHSTRAHAYKQQRRYHCNECFTSYSVTVDTIFHGSHVELTKWFRAIFLLRTSRVKISARRLSSLLGVNKSTASRMMRRIQKLVEDEPELVRKIVQFQSSRDLD